MRDDDGRPVAVTKTVEMEEQAEASFMWPLGFD